MSAVAEYAIETDGLSRRFGDFVAVDSVTLKIPKGHLYGFLGLNGAGKTTTNTDRYARMGQNTILRWGL